MKTSGLTWCFAALALCALWSVDVDAQGCCSGGSGSPIAGGTSQGVLLDRQMEVAASYQHTYSNKFLNGDSVAEKQLQSFNSNYLYFRAAYGVTKDLTVSVESGYFLNKTQVALEHADTVSSSGIGDLIIFPRYTVLNRTRENTRTEVTVGLGYKFPIGKYNDSTLVYVNPNNGHRYFTTAPPMVQPTNGSHDVIFYGFLFRGYPKKNLRLFANALYMRKGWNPLGEKFGDYASVGLFAGKTYFERLGITLQLKGEWIGKLQHAKHVDVLALYNVDPGATGSRKLFVVPQLSYSIGRFTAFALTEIPLYQHVNATQLASDVQITSGVSYRFFTYKTGKIKNPNSGDAELYVCPMHPEVTSTFKSACPKCGMDLEKKKP
jgi:hypothetical protein